MTDYIFYYLFIGLMFNIVVATLAVKRGYSIDPNATVSSVVIWPVIIIAMITSILFPQEK